MSTEQIKINPNAPPTQAQPAVFSPKSITVNAGDNLTWFNNDISAGNAHWPAPSANDRTGWFQYQIPPGSESRGDLALGGNLVTVNVIAATNANPAVLTTQGPAPATGLKVQLSYTPPTPPPSSPSPWKAATDTKWFVATNLGTNKCSIPLDSTALGPLIGSIVMTVPTPYTLNYVCALHPDEKGTITVNPQQ